MVNYNGKMMMANQGELLVMEFFDEIPVYAIMGEGVVIRAQMGYDYEIPEGQGASEEEAAPEESGKEEESADTKKESGFGLEGLSFGDRFLFGSKNIFYVEDNGSVRNEYIISRDN